MRRAVTTAGDQITSGLQDKGFRYRAAMITLTYREIAGWQGRHINEFVKHVRQWLARRGHEFRYVWVAELQSRGAVHYHLVTWLPRGVTLPKPDKQGWWTHGSSRIEWARRPVGYLTKYASKGDLGEMPRGLRLHGRGGLDQSQRRVVSWWLLPRYVRIAFQLPFLVIRRALGGGWLAVDTGEWIPSCGRPWLASPS